MPSLDDHGILASVTIPFYIPILAISLMLVIRHGFRRESGWIYVFIFSLGEFEIKLKLNNINNIDTQFVDLLARLLGAILQVSAQLVRPINTNLYLSAAILEAAGLSPLLLTTLGLVKTVYVVPSPNIPSPPHSPI